MPFLSTLRTILLTLVTLFTADAETPLPLTPTRGRGGKKGQRPETGALQGTTSRKQRTKAVLPLEFVGTTPTGQQIMAIGCTELENDPTAGGRLYAVSFDRDVEPTSVRLVSVKHPFRIDAIAPLDLSAPVQPTADPTPEQPEPEPVAS